jgi:hypothetical protein
MAEAPKKAASTITRLVTASEHSFRDHVTGIKFTRSNPQPVDLNAESSSYINLCIDRGILLVVKEPEPEPEPK